MKALFGVANHSVHQVMSMLKALDEEGYKCTPAFLEYGDNPSDYDAPALIITGIAQFMRWQEELERPENTSWVFILDNPVRLEGLNPIHLLDVVEKDRSYVYRFKDMDDKLVRKVLDASSQASHVQITKTDTSVVPYLLQNTSCSVMNRIQTFLYCIKDTELRAKLHRVLMTWFTVEVTPDKLERRILKVMNTSKSRALASLMAHMPSLLPLQKAILHARELKAEKKSVVYDKLAEKFGVSAFDMRYIVSALSKLNYELDLSEDNITLTGITLARRQGRNLLKDEDESIPEE